MGDVLSGIFGGGSRTTQDVKADPISQAMNQMRLQQLQQLFTGTSYSDFAREQPDIYSMSPELKQLYADATAQPDLSNLMSFDDYKKLGLDQTSNYISQIATPQIMQTAALQGLEGGGMVPEAIAKGTAQVGLPFVQSLPGASTALTMAPLQASALKAATASQLFPMADYGRSLQEQDLLRRQGVVTTGLTGLPFTPTTSTAQRTSSQPMFNWFGQG